MSFFSDVSTIAQRLTSQLSVGHPSVKLLMPNDVKEVNENLWCSLAVKPGDTKQVSMGDGSSRRFRTAGVVMVGIMLKPDRGSGEALSLADDIAGYLRNWKSGNLRLRAPTVQDLGLSGGWYQVNVIVPYQSDHFF